MRVYLKGFDEMKIEISDNDILKISEMVESIGIKEKVYNLLKEKQILFDEIIEGQKIDKETIKDLIK